MAKLESTWISGPWRRSFLILKPRSKAVDAARAGFSLIELMLGVLILSILAMATAGLFKMSSDSFQTVKSSNDLMTVQNLLQLVLSDPDQCRKALYWQNPPEPFENNGSYNEPFQNPKVPRVRLTDIKLNGQTLLSTIGDYTVEPWLMSPEAPPTNVNLIDRGDGSLKQFKKYAVKIVLNGKRRDADGNERVAMRAFIPIMLVTGPSPGTPDKFYDCSSNAPDLRALCESLGGLYDSSQTPPCLLRSLDMAPTFAARDLPPNNLSVLHLNMASDNGHLLSLSNRMESDYWVVGKRSSGWATAPDNLFFSYWDGAAWNHTLDITKDKKVGIAEESPKSTLDVGGEVKLGMTTSPTELACNFTTEGAMRYNKTTHQTEVCGGGDGTAANPPSWKPFGRATKCYDKIFGGDKSIDSEKISKFLVGVCDDGCYISGFEVRGGEFHNPDLNADSYGDNDPFLPVHSCTNSSKANIGVFLVQSHRNSPTTEFEFWSGSFPCAGGSRCNVIGKPLRDRFPKAINVQLRRDSGGKDNCYQNYLKITCKPL